MSFRVVEFEAPSHWASALVNGDVTGFEDEELVEFQAYLEANPAHGWAVDCSESFVSRWNGKLTDVCTYTAHVHSARVHAKSI